MCLHHIEQIHQLTALLDVQYEVFLSFYHAGVDVKLDHQLLELIGTFFCLTYQFVMISLLRITDGTGGQKGSSQKSTLTAGPLKNHPLTDTVPDTHLSVFVHHIKGFQHSPAILTHQRQYVCTLTLLSRSVLQTCCRSDPQCFL